MTTFSNTIRSIAGPGAAGQVLTSNGTASPMAWTTLPPGGLPFTDVTSTSQLIVDDNGYTANSASLITFTLPVTAVYGTIVAVVGKGTGGWVIAQNAGQTIHFGDLSTTTGATGSIRSTNQYNNIYLLCINADTDYSVIQSQGTLMVM